MSKEQINFDIWAAKTKKAKRRTSRNAPISIKRDIDAGWDYFWSRRKVSTFHAGQFR